MVKHMDIKRITKHIFTFSWQINRAFPISVLNTIAESIKFSETKHSGEICFVVEGALESASLFRGQTANQRAIELFSQLRVWDTEQNNGVLIYLLLADRDVEIIVDRGVHTKVGQVEWENICQQMELFFKKRNFKEGVIGGVQGVTRILQHHFPPIEGKQNELVDKPIIL